jgi:monoamine oxidase
MARTRAISLLRRHLLLASAAEKSGLKTREYMERLATHGRRALSRRELLKGSAAAGLAGVLGGCSDSKAMTGTGGGPRVAIVGGGVAGLVCAYRLKQGGVDATLLEAGTRTGGRMFTARGMLGAGQLAELGGEFIDSNHSVMRALVDELGLRLDELTEESASIRSEAWFFDGAFVEDEAIVEAYRPLAARIADDLAASDESDEEFERLDALSIEAYLDGVPDLDETLRKMLTLAYVGEYGLEADEQSSFNLLWLIDSDEPEPFRVFGESDERFHVHEGNDAVPARLTDALDGQIELEQRLVRIREQKNGAIELTLDRDGTAEERVFDKVVLALPWTLLREVEMDVELPEEKQKMIDELGYGTNCKLIGQFERRVWREEHASNGSCVSEDLGGETWDTSRGQRGDQGVLTVFLGGEAGLRADEGSAEEALRDRFAAIEAFYPGAEAAYIADSALRMHWPSAPLFRGSYACFLPGQAAWSGTEGVPVGNLAFCGEHTSEEFQGYMEGAAETGERAASEILDALD